MRIPIREQLGCLVLLASMIGLAVIAIATWVTNHNFVLSIRLVGALSGSMAVLYADVLAGLQGSI